MGNERGRLPSVKLRVFDVVFCFTLSVLFAPLSHLNYVISIFRLVCVFNFLVYLNAITWYTQVNSPIVIMEVVDVV